MRAQQALPYLAALLLLAWILGSLARIGPSSTGILTNSQWLVYLVYFIPFLAVVAMIVMIAFLVINWRLLSDALGFGMAQHRRRVRKQSSTIRLAVWIGAWGIAVGVLMWRCGGIFCQGNSTQTLPMVVGEAVGSEQGLSLPPFLAGLAAPVYGLADILSSPIFALAFLGLLAVCGVIIVRSVMVSVEETRAGRYLPVEVREEGSGAVQDALRLLKMEEITSPRARIVACYERMIRAAARLGADVSVDQTARELESGIRRMFQLKGRGIAELTRLFEEARYSLHPITDDDSDQAYSCLLEIGEELETTVSAEN